MMAAEPHEISPDSLDDAEARIKEKEKKDQQKKPNNGSGGGGGITSRASQTGSDITLAEFFISENGHRTRYITKWGQWMEYDGIRWKEQETLYIFHQIKELCKKHAHRQGRNDAAKKQIESNRTISAIEHIVRYDSRIATRVDQWDADLWSINTPNGLLDLKTGIVAPHRPDHYVTKVTCASPEGECPNWMKHLHKVFHNDEELIKGFQHALGYALTGITDEQIFLFCHGKGQVGKTTTIKIVQHIFNDYWQNANIETFMMTKNPQHTAELAKLAGARLVTASETEQGMPLAEARIKMLTGGDPISARFMRQNFFTFMPQFLLIIYVNHKPALRSVDTAMRRRVHMYPFSVYIPESERDIHFNKILESEANGIMKWILEGCLAWQKEKRLYIPKEVVEATDEYFSDEDVVMSWIKERVVFTKDLNDGFFSSSAWNDYQLWTANNREFTQKQKIFYREIKIKLQDEGLKYNEDFHQRVNNKDKKGAGYTGGRLKDQEDPIMPIKMVK